MPFQDVDEISSQETPRTPSSVNRILRRLFIEDWNLKLLSLAITLVLWFVVTGQNTPVNTHASAQLTFIRPSGLEISNEPPKTIDVLLTGNRYRLEEWNKTSLVAIVDISDQKAGERVLRLADRSRLDLPQGVTVQAFQPSAISIRLEPVIDRQLEIEAMVDGTPAEGYEVYAVRPFKPTVNVHGPASNVKAIGKVKTESISVAGRRETFTAENVAIDVFDPKVDLQEPTVNVEIEIGERRIEKEFSDVRVAMQGGNVQPSYATVVVYGPPRLLTDLKPADMTLVLPPNADTSKATINLAMNINDSIQLRSVKPSRFRPIQ